MSAARESLIDARVLGFAVAIYNPASGRPVVLDDLYDDPIDAAYDAQAVRGDLRGHKRSDRVGVVKVVEFTEPS